MAISKENIVQASIEILNRDGIENLSMRTLAKELDIKAASLYWHISSKQNLYGLIAEELCSKIENPCSLDDPMNYILDLNMQFRRVLLEVRDSISIFTDSLPNTPNRLKIIKDILYCLSKLGVKEENCVTAANMINNYVLSFTADEIRMRATPPEAFEKLGDSMGIKGLKFDNFDEQFLYGMNVLFAGFKVI